MATGTTVFSRVTVVAPKTRIDLALPADVVVADLLPMVLDLANENSADGGARHGGWCLAKLGADELDPTQTLATQEVWDGELLQLRRRADNPPPPLYDDVVDALAEAEPGSYRPWTKETAAKVGHAAGGLGMIVAAATLGLAGYYSSLGPHNFFYGGVQAAAAVAALLIAVFATGVGSVIARAYAAPTTGTVIAAAGGLSMAFVAGFNVVPGFNPRPALLLASALLLMFASASIMLIGAGIVTFIGVATVGTFGTLAMLVATVFPNVPLAAVAAGAGAAALAGISLLPRLTMQLAKLPLPHIPTNAEDFKDDGGFPDYYAIERKSGLAHQYMTGLIIGCGATAALSAVLSATSTEVWGPIFAAVVAAVLMLRGRTYANSAQAIALLFSGLATAAGLAVGMLVQFQQPKQLAALFVPLMLLGVASILFGVVFPNRRFSPVARRSVDLLEAVLIAAVLPLALGVMDVYTAVRDLNINF